MTWKQKFSDFVLCVLNAYSQNGLEYKMEIVDDHNVIVTHPQEPMLKNWSRDDLPSHWKEAGSVIIKAIMDRRVKSYLK